MKRQAWKRLALKILAVLICAGALKQPFEESLQASSRRLNLRGKALSLELRSKLGQNLAVALLSGFRGVVADFVWIRAHHFWEDQVWFKMKEGIELAVVLQPHSIPFWDLGSWHMAWNASHAEGNNPTYSSDAYRLRMKEAWIQAGNDFLKEGIRNNPDSYDLHFKMGWLLYQRLNNPLAAAAEFEKAAAYENAPLYIGRMIGHMFERAKQPRMAYECWKKLWMQDHQKTPDQLWHKIEEWGAEAEDELKIPHEERVFPPAQKSPILNGTP